MKRVSPTIVEIDLEALRFNFCQLKKKVPQGTRILCVVKSNAYGHGAARVSKVLQEEGADFFGTGTVDEGIELREAGVKRPILLLMGLIADHFESLLRYQLTPVIYDEAILEPLNGFLVRAKKRLSVHIKVDTGMTRLGILPENLDVFFKKLKELPALEPEGLLTHLADATDNSFTEQQKKIFEKAKTVFHKYFGGNRIRHLANSQAVMDQKGTPSVKVSEEGSNDEWMVRFGIALYGAYPSPGSEQLMALKPVMTWKTKIISLKKIPLKRPVSYGRTFYTKKESLIGVLPVGYADGYPRLLSNRAHVLVRGKPVPVVGTICMDMMMVDLTSVPNARVGDEVVLLGAQGSSRVRAEELASQAETISYEIFCRIAERISRVYR